MIIWGEKGSWKEQKKREPTFYGAKDAGIRVTRLQRKTGIINSLCCSLKVIVY